MRPNITAKTTLSIARQRTPPAIQDNISDPTKKLLILVTQLRNYLCIHVTMLGFYIYIKEIQLVDGGATSL